MLKFPPGSRSRLLRLAHAHSLPALLLLGQILAAVAVLWALPARGQIVTDREPAGPSSRRTGLVLTEIMYNPRPVPGLDTNLTLEFVELYNSKPWAEDLSGFSISGSVHFTFPAGIVLSPGAYLVVARVPDLITTRYGVTNVLGPWDGAATNRLPTDRGIVQLLHPQGALLLEVGYADSPPWPEAADGTGHSLVLVRPSIGENDPRAWAESDTVGGSPGRADPIPAEPLAPVVINELQNHSDPADWIELYNHSNRAIDLSGAWLSDDPLTNKFRIPNGTTIPAQGFMVWYQTQLGFELFAGGETVFFWNSNQTRVLDVVDFRGQSNNFTTGRSPDGGPNFYGLALSGRTDNTHGTPGGPNTKPLQYPVVITEIMYNPISGNTDDEFVEFHNRTARAIDISGWEFVVGVNYAFPTNLVTTSMPAGAYWVLARNPTNLFAIYPNLNTNNTFGPYTGTLANGGERLALAAADYDAVTNPGTNRPSIVKLPVVISDVTYGDRGRWGNWSDGLGSSLELIDVQADVRHAANWADSSDVAESAWTAIEATVPLGETLGPIVNDRLILFQQGVGECLIDELEVRVDDGPNLVVNGGFESGLAGWSLQGSHDFSTVEEPGFAGSKCLHLRAGSRGDNQSNRILSAPLLAPIPATARQVSIRCKAKWLRGLPEVLMRLHGSATEAYGRMSLPRRLGSPGQVNSRNVANAGPAVYTVTHAPLAPATGAPVIVSARATDPQGVTSLTLRYRLDPATNFIGVTMVDTGTGGDAVANDGLFSAVIPGQAAGQIVAFYVEARDALGAVGTFPKELLPPAGLTRCWPNDAVSRECVVRWGEVQMPGDFATYHLWVTSGNSNRWHTRDPMNNTPMDATFVYNNTRVIYNALPLYSGSPWHRTNSTTGPAGVNRVDYEMNFPSDDPLLGTTDFVLNNPGNPDITTISDLSAVAEATVYRIFEGMDLPFNHRRYIHFFVNGSQRSKAYERPGNFIFEDSQQPNGDMIGQWFPTDAGGTLFKVEDWFEFENNGFDFHANNDADLARRTGLVNGQPTLLAAPYRFMFRKRSVSVGASANDYSAIFNLIDAVSPADAPNSPAIDLDSFSAVADWETWMRHFAVQRAVGNWDSYGWERGKNDYLYRAPGSGFHHMPWDIDYGLGLGRGPTEPLFNASDPRVLAMFNTPAIVRAYWRAFDDLVSHAFTSAWLEPHIDARVNALTANNVDLDLTAVDSIKAYVTDRRAYLQSQLATVVVPFGAGGPPSFATTNNLLYITGSAPVQVKNMLLNGVPYPVTWTSVTNFQMVVVLAPGVNSLILQGLDRAGNLLPSALYTLSPEYVGPAPNPVGALILSEILYAPSRAGAQFVEIVNRSPLSFDLAGWRLEGVNLTFPTGSVITNGQTIVLAANKTVFQSVYGRIPVFAQLGSAPPTRNGVLFLVATNVAGDYVVGGVHYEQASPWPIPAAGQSLQVIDLAQDASRPANWGIGVNPPATPGAPNSVAAVLPAFDPVWLNEAQFSSLAGPLDNRGEAAPWIELYNSGALSVSLDGYYLIDNFTNLATAWAFPGGTLLAPGEHRLIWADGQTDQSTANDLHAGFALNQSGQLGLSRMVAGLPQVTDYLRWNDLGVNLSYGSFPDGQSIQRLVLHSPSPGATNEEARLRVYINEWMARNSLTLTNPVGTKFDDWFEIYNAESVTVDLAGYWLTDNAANPMKFRIPTNGQYRLPPRGFLMVWADNQPTANAGNRPELHVNFQLGGSGGDIGLFLPDGLTPVNVLTYGNQTNDVSEGRFADGASARYFMPKTTPRGPNLVEAYNSPPVFPFIGTQTVAPGQTITVPIKATDPEGSPLSYAVVSAPPVPQLNQNGLYRWVVPAVQPVGDYPVTLSVTDAGTPPRSATVTFLMVVRTNGVVVIPPTPPSFERIFTAGGQVSFSIETVPGRLYRVTYTDDLAGGIWTALDTDFVAGGPVASLSDALATPQRFYRVQRLD